MVNGLPYIKNDDEVCEGCIFGKQHRETFSNRTWKARERITLGTFKFMWSNGDCVFWKGTLFSHFH
jgi:hypothetical protein